MLYQSETGTPYNFSYYNLTVNNFTFNSNNTAESNYVSVDKELNLDASRCGAPVYFDNSENDHDVASYSYNATTKQLSIIYDNGGMSNGDYYVEICYDVTITANKLSFHSTPAAESSDYHYVYLVR